MCVYVSIECGRSPVNFWTMGIKHSHILTQDYPLFLDGPVLHKGLLFLGAGTKLRILCMHELTTETIPRVGLCTWIRGMGSKHTEFHFCCCGKKLTKIKGERVDLSS